MSHRIERGKQQDKATRIVNKRYTERYWGALADNLIQLEDPEYKEEDVLGIIDDFMEFWKNEYETGNLENYASERIRNFAKNCKVWN